MGPTGRRACRVGTEHEEPSIARARSFGNIRKLPEEAIASAQKLWPDAAFSLYRLNIKTGSQTGWLGVEGPRRSLHKGDQVGEVEFIHEPDRLLFRATIDEGHEEYMGQEFGDVSLGGSMLRSSQRDSAGRPVTTREEVKPTELSLAPSGTGMHAGAEVLVRRAATEGTPRLDAMKRRRVRVLTPGTYWALASPVVASSRVARRRFDLIETSKRTIDTTTKPIRAIPSGARPAKPMASTDGDTIANPRLTPGVARAMPPAAINRTIAVSRSKVTRCQARRRMFVL